jgi:hypothetical protein
MTKEMTDQRAVDWRDEAGPMEQEEDRMDNDPTNTIETDCPGNLVRTTTNRQTTREPTRERKVQDV